MDVCASESDKQQVEYKKGKIFARGLNGEKSKPAPASMVIFLIAFYLGLACLVLRYSLSLGMIYHKQGLSASCGLYALLIDYAYNAYYVQC